MKGFERRIFNLHSHRPPDPLFPYSAGSLGTGANMAWDTGILRQLGGFDPALTNTGAEDISAFYDAITKGFTIVYEPAAIVYHEHRRDYSDLKKQMYWYGIGLGAYLTRCVMTDPKHILRFAAKAPAGAKHLLSGASRKNRRKSALYPKELTRLERRGALRGPLAYLRGRRDVARAQAAR
jgi:hypothetical protein